MENLDELLVPNSSYKFSQTTTLEDVAKEFPMFQGFPYVSRSSLCLKEFPMFQGFPYVSEICVFNI